MMHVTSRRIMRRALVRLLQPFMNEKTGYDLHAYGFREAYSRLQLPDQSFTCQVNGKVGSARLLEDFFLVLLCGFDIVGVEIDQKTINRTGNAPFAPFTTVAAPAEAASSRVATAADGAAREAVYSMVSSTILGSTWAQSLEGMACHSGTGAALPVLPHSGRVLVDYDVATLQSHYPTAVSRSNDPYSFSGCLHLVHSRTFLGWKPPLANEIGDGRELGALISSAVRPDDGPLGTLPSVEALGDHGVGEVDAAEGARAVCQPSTLANHPRIARATVPFTSRIEGIGHHISHLVFRAPAIEVITAMPGCPDGVKECLGNEEALKMLVTLRRAGVNPSLITEKALRSVSVRKESWSSALGIL